MRDDSPGTLLLLVLAFSPLSLAAIGGGSSILPDIQRQAVEVHRWVTERQFIDFFAIARAAPGPGSMLVTLIGWTVAGWAGAVVATGAIYLPSALLAYTVGRAWDRYRGRKWHTALGRGLTPVGTGLILSGVVALFRVSGAGPLAWGVALGSGIILLRWPRLPPLAVLAAGALIFSAQRVWA